MMRQDAFRRVLDTLKHLVSDFHKCRTTPGKHRVLVSVFSDVLWKNYRGINAKHPN